MSIFIIYGRSIYMPIINRVKGKQSVETITETLIDSVYDRLQSNLDAIGINKFPDKLILLGLKEERVLQVYGDTEDGIKYIKEYPFTAMSGTTGPKLQRGDYQIPEGIYGIEYLNPNSSYYLSMKISYPNDFDKSKSTFTDVADMGDNIFIHGKSVTVGCIPIGDEAIEELFIMVEKASVEEVKVIISPRDFRVNNSYPSVAGIDWEDKLYEMIDSGMVVLPKVN